MVKCSRIGSGLVIKQIYGQNINGDRFEMSYSAILCSEKFDRKAGVFKHSQVVGDRISS